MRDCKLRPASPQVHQGAGVIDGKRRESSNMMNNRRSTRMRAHVQPAQSECNNESPSSGSDSSKENNGHMSCGISSDGKQSMNHKQEKISFISCARGFPVDQAIADYPFSPPDLAPTFRPTEQEFAAGPLKYIESIRHVAEAYGICKIIPPAVSFEQFILSIFITIFCRSCAKGNERRKVTYARPSQHSLSHVS